MKIMKYLILLIMAFGFVHSIDVTECMRINDPGTYELVMDLEYEYEEAMYFMESRVCMIIDSDDVILDCHDHGISSIESTGFVAPSLYILSGDNIIVKNCNFNSVRPMFAFELVTNLNMTGNIFNATLTTEGSNTIINNNDFYQPYVSKGISSLITDNIFYEDSKLSVTGEDSIITSNEFINCSSSYALNVGSTFISTDNNVISYNTFNDCNTAINLINSNDNEISDNTVSNSEVAFSSEDCSWNTFTDNTFCFNDQSMVCEGPGYEIDGADEGRYNYCESSTITGCDITCMPCTECDDPDAGGYLDGIMVPGYVTIESLGVTETYGDLCVVGEPLLINEAVCFGSHHVVRSCPDGYFCDLDSFDYAYCTEESSTVVCNDMDGGDDTETASGCFDYGSGILTSGMYCDYCAGDVLHEQVCTSTGCVEIEHECTDCVEVTSSLPGCLVAGFCDVDPSECSDTDETDGYTFVPDLFGTATDTLGGSYSDLCLDDDILNEAYCTPSGVAMQREVMCYDGYCDLETNECKKYCTDTDPTNDVTFPGMCTCGEVNRDECYGRRHTLFGVTYTHNIRQYDCDDAEECFGIEYPNCDCEEGEDAYCVVGSGICVCDDSDFPPDIEDTECSETDGGNDIWRFGVTTFIVGGDPLPDESDYCDGDVLNEYYCESREVGVWPFRYEVNARLLEPHLCEHGCEEGRCLPPEGCTDLDVDSPDPYAVPSSTLSRGAMNQDSCSGLNILIEQYCDGVTPLSEEHYCEFGCRFNPIGEGYCLPPPEICYDDDPTQDLYVPGICIDDRDDDINYDVCVASGNLLQFGCGMSTGGESCIPNIYHCPEGEECEDGACVPFTCSDVPDFGFDINNYSECFGATVSGDDYCVDGSEGNIVEYYCGDDQECHSRTESCDSGVCYEGECVQCNDTDGLDPNTFNQCVSDSNVLNDTCFDSTKVLEAYCSEGYCRHIQLDCPSSEFCYEGVCSDETCGDSDGGINIYEAGLCRSITETSSDSLSDECHEDSTDSIGILNEAYCNGLECVMSKRYCPVGYTCREGACVMGSKPPKPEPIPLPEGIDSRMS